MIVVEECWVNVYGPSNLTLHMSELEAKCLADVEAIQYRIHVKMKEVKPKYDGEWKELSKRIG